MAGSEVTEKTRWNAMVEAHRMHAGLTGLQMRFETNGLDSGPVKKAANAIAKLAEEVQTKLDAAIQQKADYRKSVQPENSGLDAALRENEELKARLAAFEKR